MSLIKVHSSTGRLGQNQTLRNSIPPDNDPEYSGKTLRSLTSFSVQEGNHNVSSFTSKYLKLKTMHPTLTNNRLIIRSISPNDLEL